MGLAIKNNQLQGTLDNGKTWEVKLKIAKSPVPKAYYLHGCLFIDGNYQTNICLTYAREGCSLNLPDYVETARKLITSFESVLGVQILKSTLKIAV